MRIKNILVGIFFAAAVLLSACSQKQDPEMAAADAELQQKLVGVWFYPESAVYDEDGNLTSFSAYQFTDRVVKCHEASTVQIMSYLMDEYTIKDGQFVVEKAGKKQYAIISIREVDGKDHLFWDIETKTMEFIRMTDEEIAEYCIPADSYLSGEAELLGIETTAAESENVSVTTAASE